MSDAAKEVLTLEELQKRITRAPYHQWLGLNVVGFTEDSIEVRATWRDSAMAAGRVPPARSGW